MTPLLPPTCETCHFPHGHYRDIPAALTVFGRGYTTECEDAAKRFIGAEVANAQQALVLREQELVSNGLLAENAKLKVDAVKLTKQLEQAIAHGSRETNKVIGLATKYEHLQRATGKFWGLALEREFGGKKIQMEQLAPLIEEIVEEFPADLKKRLQDIYEKGLDKPKPKRAPAKKAAQKKRR